MQSPPPLTTADRALADAVGQLSLFFCKEAYVDGSANSTVLVYFSGVLGFSASGSSFERPRNYTPKLSGLIYCMRLCALEATLPRFTHRSNDWQARPRIGHVSRLNSIRERYMCFGCQAPMGELLSLRSYGRAFSRSDGPSFRVNWSDDGETVSWSDGILSMKQFRELGARVHNQIAASTSRLMYGWEPQLELKDVRDRMSDHESGYSFIQDPANNLRSRYLDLSSRACLDPIDGLMSGERWNFDAVRRYLKEESSLVLLIFQMLALRAGQAPRTSELSSLECYNGPSTARGIYVHDGRIVYITRHAKARQATNQEFQVARYLCVEDSMLFARYLVYIRPFVDMLYRKCYGHEAGRRLLFAAPDQPQKPWGADVLTKALKGLTQVVCGTAFGVQVYRQISIAVTERHIKALSHPFDRYDDRSPRADIEVVFAWQSGHRPVQRGTSYGIDAAYPDSLQPTLLRVYKWASEEWHQFLRVDQRSSNSLSDAATHVGEQTGTSQKRRTTDLAGNQPSKRTRVCEDDETPATQETTESQAVHSHSLPERRSLPCESSIGLVPRDVDSALAASGRRKEGPVSSPPTVARRSVVANPPSPPDLRHDVVYGSLTARGQSRIMECSREGHPDSDYETVPESPAVGRTDNSGSSVQLVGKAGGDLSKDAKECVGWWLGKCAFCVGKGMGGREVLHHMHKCSRGGQEQYDRELGEHFFLSEFRVKRGCRRCGLPFSVCGAWKHLSHLKSDKKLWRRLDSAHCASDSITYEVVVGFFQCGAEYYWLDLATSAEEAGVDLGDLEELAVWLCRPLWYDKSRAANLVDFFIRWTKKAQRVTSAAE